MRELFEYAVIRVIPRIERGEQVNVGVILYCQRRDFLAARIDLDAARLRAIDPAIDLELVREALDPWARACEGDGPSGALRLGERFRWLTAPRSTIIQTSPVHNGLTEDPDAELDRLVGLLVR
jgi:hypothetical protein